MSDQNKASQSKPSLLLIDDDEGIHDLVDVMLKPFEVSIEHAYSGREGLAMAISQRPDLVMLDYQMPDVDGLTVLKSLKREFTLEAIPTIMITASDDPTLISQTFALGAADYVRKPFVQSELKARVFAALKTQRLMRELEIAAQTDPLTGLLNRKALSQRFLQDRCGHASPTGKSQASLYIDLDQFKRINDTLGHGVGDQLIQEVASRLDTELQFNPSIQAMSHSYSLARVGGDEFIAVIDGIFNSQDALRIAQHLSNALSRRYSIGSNSFYSSASFGVAYSSDGSVQLEDLMQKSDIALYQAKSAGRDCVMLFDRQMQERLQHRESLERSLRIAVDNRDFHLVYQPIIDLGSGRIDSVEALIRWDHPEHGVVSPGEFIPLAEEIGLINEIGRWCMEEAFQQLSAWKRTIPCDAPKCISVNVARQQLLQPRFAEQVLEIANKHGVSPKNVHLEVSESEMMIDVNISTEAMRSLRKYGFKIHVDDFGTGYSSLACLNQFPIDTLKLDRSLIANITTQPYSRKLVEFVLRLAKETNVSLIAEGIETQEQHDLLIEWGCQFGQGYLIARPMPGESYSSFASVWNRKHSSSVLIPNRAGLDASVAGTLPTIAFRAYGEGYTER